MRKPSIRPRHYEIPEGMVDGVGLANDEIRWQPKTYEQFLAELSPERRAQVEARRQEFEALGDGPEARALLMKRLEDMKKK